MPQSQITAANGNSGQATIPMMTFDDGAGGPKSGAATIVDENAAPINSGNPFPVELQGAVPLPADAATESSLAALLAKTPSALASNPDPATPAMPVRQAPQQFVDCSFAEVGSGLQTTSLMTLVQTGTGMAVNQSAGNLVITSGTTANSETIIRSNQTFNGAMVLKAALTLSQRIANNNFYVELVDLIGSGLAYTIVNATTVDVTKAAHGFTAVNVGQRMDLSHITGAAGIPMEAVIASIPNTDTIRFTVAGWPATGSGTCDLVGWNKFELLYSGTTATSLLFNTRRKGWQNTAATGTINTTASGHVAVLSIANGLASIADKTQAAAAAITARTAWDANIPQPDVELYLQIRAKNGTTAPATTTTWTIGMWRVEDYVQNKVEISGVAPQNIQNYFPVNIAQSIALNASLAATANAIGDVGIQYRANATGAASGAHIIAAASTNATIVKASAGRVLGWQLANTTASWVYVKLHNQATLPTAGTGVVRTIAIPPNNKTEMGFEGGIGFATGIGMTIVTGSADADATAVAAGSVVGDLFFA